MIKKIYKNRLISSSIIEEVENASLLREGRKIVEALGKMFAPFCEVVLHDLSKPDHSVIAIECPLSDRKIGYSITELGVARSKNPNFPDIVQNYANRFPDGRSAKSTSIGLKNSSGKFVAAICMNLDISAFLHMQQAFERFTMCETSPLFSENLRHRALDDIRLEIESYAITQNRQPNSLNKEQRNAILQRLQKAGLMQLRNAATTVSEVLGISRASVYNYLKEK